MTQQQSYGSPVQQLPCRTAYVDFPDYTREQLPAAWETQPTQPLVVVETPTRPQASVVINEHHNQALPHVAIVAIVAVAIVAIVALFLSTDFGQLALGAMAATVAWWGAYALWQILAGRR